MPYSQLSADPELDQIIAAAERLAGCAVHELDPVSDGANSRVFRMRCAAGGTYALKSYPSADDDPRNRLETEVAALRFLDRHGVIRVPKIAALSPSDRIVLFHWIAGTAFEDVTPADIDDALGFVETLRGLNSQAGADKIALASEACLSPQDIVDQIDGRIGRLQAFGAADKSLATFLDGPFFAAYREILAWARDGLEGSGIGFFDQIRNEERTLSPSDFGFHNALRTAAGEPVYLDFEYFGHDDPVKLTADFLLHPAMQLAPSQKTRFASGVSKIFKDYSHFLTRLQYLMPLYGLRWCLIILNEFVPASWARRRRAGATETHDQAKARQLQKSQELVAWVHKNYRDLGVGVGSSD